MGGLLHLVQRGPAQSPHRCTKCNSPSINCQCTNFILFDVALGGFSGNALVSINVVTLRWARLVPGWVTVFGQVNYLGM